VNAAARDSPAAVEPGFTIVVPTRHESANVVPLLDRLQSTLAGESVEVLFVDDSDDDTPDVIRSAAAGRRIAVGLLHREAGDRDGGLSGAVFAGIRAARAPWVIVMDGDLQHPPEVLPALMAQTHSGADVVVASRYTNDGSAEGLAGASRAAVSRSSNAIVSRIFPGSLSAVSDPMSGFFAVRVEAVRLDALRPQGYKILLEILTRSPGLVVTEIPFVFGERVAGDSKASVREGVRFVRQMVSARLGAGRSSMLARMGGFLLVGLSGIVVNTAVLYALTSSTGLAYQVAGVIATQLAIIWNFALIDRFVLIGHRRPLRLRFLRFWAFNTALLPLQLVLLTAGVELAGLSYATANVVMLALVFVLRYVVSARWIFAVEPGRADVIDLRPAPAENGGDVAAKPVVALSLWRRGITRVIVLLLFVGAAYGQALSRLEPGSQQRTLFLLAATAPIPVVLLFRGVRRGGEIEDHQIDMIVAFVLLGSALLMMLRWRSDGGGSAESLTSLPLFVAGATALLYGVGALGRARLPLALALLAATPVGSAIVGTHSSQLRLVILMIAIAGVGLLPLAPRPAARPASVRAVTGPVIGAAPFVATSFLMLIAAGALAATLWQAPAFSSTANHPSRSGHGAVTH
jgi:putative flippase GtrA